MTSDPNAGRASYVGAARELLAFDLGTVRVDIRGWSVFASDSRRVGTVDRFMVEQATKRVRYVSLVLTTDAVPTGSTLAGSVLIPIGLVRRYDRQQAVVLVGLTSAMVASAPRLHARPVMRADEDATLSAFGLPTSEDVAGNLYDCAHFDERCLLLSEPET